jgi:hypothetical protein
MPIKSFRGQIEDGGQDTIPLTTRNGSTGYRIVKFQTIGKTLGTQASESTMKIYKVPQSASDADIDFNDPTLLAVAYWKSHGDTLTTQDIIFDRDIFNQDIFITNQDTAGDDQPCNYYLELEVMKLNANENTAATLKNIRANANVD